MTSRHHESTSVLVLAKAGFSDVGGQAQVIRERARKSDVQIHELAAVAGDFDLMMLLESQDDARLEDFVNFFVPDAVMSESNDTVECREMRAHVESVTCFPLRFPPRRSLHFRAVGAVLSAYVIAVAKSRNDLDSLLVDAANWRPSLIPYATPITGDCSALFLVQCESIGDLWDWLQWLHSTRHFQESVTFLVLKSQLGLSNPPQGIRANREYPLQDWILYAMLDAERNARLILGWNEDGLSQKEIRELLGVEFASRSGVQGDLQALQNENLIRDNSSLRAGKLRRFILTDGGRKLAMTIADNWQRQNAGRRFARTSLKA